MRRTLTDDLLDEMTPAFAPVPRPVAEIDPVTKKVIEIFKSINDTYKKTGIDRHSISNCCNGKYKQVRGRKFVWVRSLKKPKEGADG